MIQFDFNVPGAGEFTSLRRHVGWHDLPLARAEEVIAHSDFFVCARIAGVLIGTARVVSDKRLFFYIQDVVVHKDLRRKGIGRGLVERALRRIAQQACPGAFVGLFSIPEVTGFYTRLGFEIYEGPNTPMHLLTLSVHSEEAP
jgi:N-acetylglutamate synthase-like GNAT family acetyltransferase